MPMINPKILRWARETAGLTQSQAAAAIGLKDGKRSRAVDKLEALESGESQPSRSQLLKMSQRYRRPLLVFYLDNPPARGDRGEDFRSIPDRQTDAEARIDTLVRDIRARQATVRDLIVEDDNHRVVPFVGTMKISDGIDKVIASMQDHLRTDHDEYRSQSTPERAFSLLRSHAETAGVFVLLIGNLGSHHTTIDAEAFRGFALSDNVAPFIVINDQDAPTAWSFTLLHELAHIWLGATGVSGKSSDIQIERFCNDVAARFLLPMNELASLGLSDSDTPEIAAHKIESFAVDRHLSRSMVAYSLFRSSQISEQTWKTLSSWFAAQWRKGRDARKERQKDKRGPDYYVVRRHRLGRALLETVSRGLEEGSLTPTRASKVLGVKARSVAMLLSQHPQSNGQAA